jgi:hypothetical protein
MSMAGADKVNERKQWRREVWKSVCVEGCYGSKEGLMDGARIAKDRVGDVGEKECEWDAG